MRVKYLFSRNVFKVRSESTRGVVAIGTFGVEVLIVEDLRGVEQSPVELLESAGGEPGRAGGRRGGRGGGRSET